jgi:hypothetical protein
MAMLTRYNHISEWVTTIICINDKIKDRGRIVLKFLEISSKLRQFNNFHGVMQIVTGIFEKRKKTI